MEIPKFDPNNIEGTIEMPLEGRIVDTVDLHGMQEADEKGVSYIDRMNTAYGAGNWQVRNKDPQHFTEAEREQYQRGMDLVDIVVSEEGDAYAEHNTEVKQADLTYHQVNRQLEARQPAAVLVERSDGKIRTERVFALGKDRTHMLVPKYDEKGNRIGLFERPISTEKLSDAYQEKLAAKLASMALRDIEKPEPLTDRA